MKPSKLNKISNRKLTLVKEILTEEIFLQLATCNLARNQLFDKKSN
jgi:hypothetical protein